MLPLVECTDLTYFSFTYLNENLVLIKFSTIVSHVQIHEALPPSECWKLPLSQVPLSLSFNNNHIQLLPALPSAVPGNYTPFLKCLFLKCYISRITHM